MPVCVCPRRLKLFPTWKAMSFARRRPMRNPESAKKKEKGKEVGRLLAATPSPQPSPSKGEGKKRKRCGDRSRLSPSRCGRPTTLWRSFTATPNGRTAQWGGVRDRGIDGTRPGRGRHRRQSAVGKLHGRVDRGGVERVCTRAEAPDGHVFETLFRVAGKYLAALMGGRRLVTYSLQSETGASLRGTGGRSSARPARSDRGGARTTICRERGSR